MEACTGGLQNSYLCTASHTCNPAGKTAAFRLAIAKAIPTGALGAVRAPVATLSSSSPAAVSTSLPLARRVHLALQAALRGEGACVVAAGSNHSLMATSDGRAFGCQHRCAGKQQDTAGHLHQKIAHGRLLRARGYTVADGRDEKSNNGGEKGQLGRAESGGGNQRSPYRRVGGAAACTQQEKKEKKTNKNQRAKTLEM